MWAGRLTKGRLACQAADTYLPLSHTWSQFMPLQFPFLVMCFIWAFIRYWTWMTYDCSIYVIHITSIISGHWKVLFLCSHWGNIEHMYFWVGGCWSHWMNVWKLIAWSNLAILWSNFKQSFPLMCSWSIFCIGSVVSASLTLSCSPPPPPKKI